jgi:putative thioredoxin
MPRTFVTDATDADFQQKVLLRSREVPVLVDFWAPWCGPCKTLSPTLEKLAAEYAGAFELIKINVDDSPQVAAAFQIQSIPTVYLIKDGRPLDGFQGGLTEPQLRKFLDRHVQRPAADPLETAAAAMAAGLYDQAAAAYRELLAAEPAHGEALVGLARVALAHGDLSAAQGWIDRVPTGSPAYDAAQRLRGMLGFAEDAGDPAALQRRVEADPKDVAAWYALGATLALQNRIDEAFAAFLEVVARDRAYREDAGRKALLSLFDLVGAADPRVLKARRRLASLLF